jgi:hypothetical protein
MPFGGFARLLKRANRVFMSLAGKLMGGETALTMGGGGSGVGVCGKVVVFGGTIVWALGHESSPLRG